MTQRFFGMWLLLLCLTCTPCPVAAETSLGQTMAFAEHLFANGDYYRAITEYERVVFFFPQDDAAKTAALQIARAYQLGGKLQLASERFRALSEEQADTPFGSQALFLLAETYLLQKDYALAADTFDAFIQRYPASEQVTVARQRLGLCLLQLGNWQGAAEQFRALPRTTVPEEDIQRLASTAEQYPHVPQKSPYLATGLSAVLPGAGQLYVGRPKDAFTSFLLNGLFIWGAIEAFENGNNVTGAILVAFESGWYGGNLYNAANSAHKYNRRIKQEFIDNLRLEYGLTCYPNAQGQPLLAVGMRF